MEGGAPAASVPRDRSAERAHKEKKARKRARKEKRERRERGRGGRDRSSSSRGDAWQGAKAVSVDTVKARSRTDSPRARVETKPHLSPRRSEQPKLMLTPSTRPSLTPRIADKKWSLMADDKVREDKAAEDEPGVGATIPQELCTADLTLNSLEPTPLPPATDSTGYVGQYVQSALTGDFVRADRGFRGFQDTDASLKRKTTDSLTHPTDFRRMMKTVLQTFSHLQAVLIFMFIFVLYVAEYDLGDFAWYYMGMSDATQKIINVLSFTAFSMSLFPLAVVNSCTVEELTEQAARNQQEHDGGAEGRTYCGAARRLVDSCCGPWLSQWGVATLSQGCSMSYVRVHYMLLSSMYGVVVILCLMTAAYDDVLYMHRDLIDREHSPRARLVSRMGLNGGPPARDPFPGVVVPGATCPGVSGTDFNPSYCQEAGCCWCSTCARPGTSDAGTCTVPHPRPVRVEFNIPIDDDEPQPFFYTMAVERCAAIGMQLCTKAEICSEGQLTSDVQALIPAKAPVSPLTPVFDQRWLFVDTAKSCEASVTAPKLLDGKFQAFCCRGIMMACARPPPPITSFPPPRTLFGQVARKALAS